MLAELNSASIYVICGGIILFVAVVCVIFLIRAYKAGIAAGMDKAMLKRADDYVEYHILGVAERGYFAGCHSLIGQFGNPVAVA